MSFAWLGGLDLWWAAALISLLYAALLAWVVTRPREVVLGGAPDRRRWRDLRLWIVPLILAQVVLHWLFR